jgi:cytidylate kinase
VQRLSGDGAIAAIGRLLDGTDARLTLIAVDGHSAAGKSTFARRLARRLSAAIIEADAFYRVLDPEVREALDARAGLDQYYDWQRLRSVLSMIRA